MYITHSEAEQLISTLSKDVVRLLQGFVASTYFFSTAGSVCIETVSTCTCVHPLTCKVVIHFVCCSQCFKKVKQNLIIGNIFKT